MAGDSTAVSRPSTIRMIVASMSDIPRSEFHFRITLSSVRDSGNADAMSTSPENLRFSTSTKSRAARRNAFGSIALAPGHMICGSAISGLPGSSADDVNQVVAARHAIHGEPGFDAAVAAGRQHKDVIHVARGPGPEWTLEELDVDRVAVSPGIGAQRSREVGAAPGVLGVEHRPHVRIELRSRAHAARGAVAISSQAARRVRHQV